MQHICDIDIAISETKRDAATYETWMQVWLDREQDCYVSIREDVVDVRKNDGTWLLVYEVDKHGAETFY